MISKKIIESILSENAINAKKLIEEDLAVKLGERLAEEYVRVSKQTFNEDYEYGPAVTSEEEDEEEMMDNEDNGEEDDEEEMTEEKNAELAAMYGDPKKVTRGDIIAAALKNKNKKSKK